MSPNGTWREPEGHIYTPEGPALDGEALIVSVGPSRNSRIPWPRVLDWVMPLSRPALRCDIEGHVSDLESYGVGCVLALDWSFLRLSGEHDLPPSRRP